MSDAEWFLVGYLGAQVADIKQTAIENLQKSFGFIVICDDGEKTYFGGEGLSLNKSLGLIERYKHKLLVDSTEQERGE